MSSVETQEARYRMSEETAGPAEEEAPARPAFTDQQRQEVRDLVAELFGITGEDDPLIDMPMIAELAGVAPGTPGAWQQRTREGTERIPFPAPHDDRYLDKPQWRAVRFVEEFLWPSGRWEKGRGTVARTSTRVTKRYTFKQMSKVNPELAAEIVQLGVHLADDKVRSLQGWRSHRTRAANAKEAKRQKRRNVAA